MINNNGLIKTHLTTYQISSIHGNDSFGSDSNGDVVEQALRQLLLDGLDIFLVQIGAKESNATIDIESNTA